MEKLKERMRRLKDDLEAAQQRETEAKNAMRDVEANLDRLGGEEMTLKSRLSVKKAKLEQINDRIFESNDKLDDAEARSEKSEERRKLLAESEVDDFERSEDVENTMKETSVLKENVAHMVVESERKVQVLEKSLAKANKRYEKFSTIVDDLSAEIFEKTESIKHLEQRDNDASERESELEDQVKQLETQLQQSLGTVDTLEREVGRLERLRDRVMTEIDNCETKEEEVRAEMEAIMNDVDDD